MASADEVFPETDCCEICGVELGDEVVIQEFADGSLARLCPECAAGANVSDDIPMKTGPRDSIWPAEPMRAAGAATAESDPLEKTRELLMPVADLIALQGEMQAALERLAASLERFAAEMITDSQDKTAVENRLRMLEHELDKTRTQLSETEFLMTVTANGEGTPVIAPGGAPTPASAPEDAFPVEPAPAGAKTKSAGKRGTPATPLVAPPGVADFDVSAGAKEAPEAPPAVIAQAAPPARPQEIQPDHLPTFRIEEVQAAQRFYNESPFTNRVREVRQSLGRPMANLTRLPGADPLAIVTVAWNIVWYQYLVDMRRDLPSSNERVTLHREGMDLDALAFYFKEKNAVVNDDGRLDASELEVRLLSDPSSLITEMTPEDNKVFEDATEEVWDQRIAPEFKWDD